MILGKPLTVGGATGGLKPTIVVTAPTGSTVTCDGITGTEVSGTWTFVVTIGSHTIVATSQDQSKTKTETVVVDDVGIYPVSISYVTYLYNLGDECEGVTGGWKSVISTDNNTPYNITLTKEAEYLQSYSTTYGSSAYYYHNANWQTKNAINVSGYSKLKALMYAENFVNGNACIRLATAISEPASAAIDLFEKTLIITNTGSFVEVEIDLTDSTSNVYVCMNHWEKCQSYRNTGRLKKVWLE